MMAVINAVMTVLAMLTFIGIVWWAWSSHRAEANRISAKLPFDLPEEYQLGKHPNDKKAGDTHE
ncbi:CcoQ/FixQ family Cbb3-type cytochrome c oxidase assembly chaperone [Castellaniella sp.]|uniref:cbb3-type cytochrome oxidase subunit 3 n=1 Tax=Castellaniella sp. TaxID=1955812 RepID=UPI002AFEEEB4|nr:CcoQ/FixQ family Cbb3-type cytochrome c oxidase assembly chaperone [Castellaniella sp.]